MKQLPHGFRLRLARIIGLLVVLLAFLLIAHPAEVPAPMLVVPFMLMFAVLYFGILEVIRFFQPEPAEGQVPLAAVFRPRLLAVLLAGFPVLLLVLQSIMELNRWDVLITLAICLLAYILISRGMVLRT